MTFDLTPEEDSAIHSIVIYGGGTPAAVNTSGAMIDALMSKGMLATRSGGFLATEAAKRYVLEHGPKQ